MTDDAVLRVDGAMTLCSAGELLARHSVSEAVSAIDLSGVTEVDSAGLAVLVEWLRGAGRQVPVVGAPASLRSLAELYDLEAALPFQNAPQA